VTRRRLWVVGSFAVLLAALVVAGKPELPQLPLRSDGTTEMDEALGHLARARETWKGVKDYTCRMIKRERIRGELQPNHLVHMKLRVEPFSVYLRWELPEKLRNQQACYVAGKNNGMMRVRPVVGLASLIGWVSLDPKDPRAMEHTRHTITEAGLGNLLERISKGWESEKKQNRTSVRTALYEYDHRHCMRVELTRQAGCGHEYHRSVVYFDREHGLPVRVEAYDWPKDGQTEGELVEVYSYVDIKTNVGLDDDAFRY